MKQNSLNYKNFKKEKMLKSNGSAKNDGNQMVKIFFNFFCFINLFFYFFFFLYIGIQIDPERTIIIVMFS